MTTTVQNKPPALWRWLMKPLNPLMKGLLRSPLHVVVSRMYLLITFTGRKSGRTYSTPVQYVQEGDTLYIVTSAGYTWWKNLRGGAAVQVLLRGKTVQGYANTSTEPQIISTVLEKIYPGLKAERRERFVPGKVALTIRLSEEGLTT
jgi:deazaflavin-dependent oxidoreductase (nitroreductase family)